MKFHCNMRGIAGADEFSAYLKIVGEGTETTYGDSSDFIRIPENRINI